jgi:hypothetical protein
VGDINGISIMPEISGWLSICSRDENAGGLTLNLRKDHTCEMKEGECLKSNFPDGAP